MCVDSEKWAWKDTDRAMGRTRDVKEKGDPVTVTVGERHMGLPAHRWTVFSHQM